MVSKKKLVIIFILFLGLLLSLYLAMYAGYKDFGINLFAKAFNLGVDDDSLILSILRYPRALKAFVAGASLALAGMFMQAISKTRLQSLISLEFHQVQGLALCFRFYFLIL